MANTLVKNYYNAATGDFRSVRHSQHIEICGAKGYVSALGRKLIEIKIYGGKTFKLDPLVNGNCKFLETEHN